jgi:hypothetical protein
MLQKYWLGSVDWIDLTQDRGQVGGSCERCDELPGTIKCGGIS